MLLAVVVVAASQCSGRRVITTRTEPIATLIVDHGYGDDLSEFVTSAGTGVLVSKDLNVLTRYRLHAEFGGRAVMIELLDRPANLASDEHVHVVLENGRVIACRVLDDTLMCAVEGEGLRQTER